MRARSWAIHGLCRGGFGQCLALDGQGDYVDCGTAQFTPPLPPGFYFLHCQPSLVTAKGPFAGRREEFSGAVYATPLPARPATERSTPGAGLEQPPQVVSLDGPGWRIATDAKNQGRGQKWSQGPVADAKPTKVPWVIQNVFPDWQA